MRIVGYSELFTALTRRWRFGHRDIFLSSMYSDFKVEDRWTGQEIHCMYQAIIMAIAARHADAVDIKFLANGRPVWIALLHAACGMAAKSFLVPHAG